MSKVAELREKRGQTIAAGRAILDKAEKEKRDLTAEEQQQYDATYKDQETLRKQIEREERQLEIEREDAKRAIRNDPNATKVPDNIPDAVRALYAGSEARLTPQYREAFIRFMATGEKRDLQADSGAVGGYTLADQQFVAELLKFVDDQVFIRGLATKRQVAGAQSLGVPSLEADPADADWTSEIATGTADTAMSFGKRELQPHPLAKRIKVSNKLLVMSGLGVEGIVRERLGYKFAITEEKGFLTGNGANQPLGIFTASANGISTNRDVVTGSATAITFDGLYDSKYKLKGNYWARARWLFHRDALKQISKLKDAQNRYLWEPSQKAGQPDMLIGLPVMMSEYVPNTFTTGLYVGALGDFSFYWIADSINFGVQRLNELYAETNQTGFIGRQEVDGMPALEEAFVRVKTS